MSQFSIMQDIQLELKQNLLASIKTNKGKTLEELSLVQPVMLIFLRHFGCIFCREAMQDISRKRQNFIDKGIRIVFVHLADDETADEVEQQIRGTISRFEPRAEVLNVIAEVKDEQNSLGVSVTFRVISTNEIVTVNQFIQRLR